ncbi:D-methionine transport system ATP-binding protein [Sphingomonas jejuensis]|uniref:D-methionine transport system ATP-binding protein n=1 Tax=Sphingomonas jejuensis TaxID=904715 RepID=A0ABX0XIV5_9SPHN|nr:ATP-binding cassette domain-containing protein [Sphingomonas jejuensis]NJC33267.1 D-methionine transport system ATP-binding protein [Sphingomonas jejuensis]
MIRFEGVSKRFAGTGGEALRAIDLDVAAGEIFGVIGASGAGKSTLVRLVNALERPTSGRVLVDGVDVAALDAAGLRGLRRKVGMIFQSFGLHSSLTVADNVGLPLRLAGREARERQERVAVLIDRVGLAVHEAKYPAQLSGGQKQRVGIARALATGPSILLCDEPTSALDPETTRSVLRLLRELNRELGLTIMLITHEMEVVREVCDRVAVIDGGTVVEMGAAADIFLDGQHPATRRLISEAGEGAPAVAPEGMALVRLTRRGAGSAAPIDGAEVLEGRIGRIGGESYSDLVLAVQPSEVERLSSLGRADRI